MRIRLALGLAALAACKTPDVHPSVDASGQPDGMVEHVDAAGPDADAAIDAPPDADPTIPDTTPPSFLAMTPAAGSATWLHAPIRLLFDEPLMSATGTATVTVAGTAVPASLTFEAPRTLVVKLDASARGVGAVEVRVDASITDLAGNAASPMIEGSLLAPAWASTPIDRGTASEPPALAVDSKGTVIASWLVGNVGARKVVISELAGSAWKNLGAALGTGDVTSTAIAVDSDGAPIVAWTEGGIAHIATWNGATWSELPSPGNGDTVAIATPAGGAPIVAVFGTVVVVRRLDAGAWTALGSDVTPPATFVGEPALVVPSATQPVIGWIGTDNVIRVYRLDASWTAMATIPAGGGSRMSLAARGSSIAVTWEAVAGSYGVLAALSTGGATSWTQLGKPLDIDISGDARGPSIAFDASGAVLVAWTELVETNWRGALARWSGSAWTIVGGNTWLASASAHPARAHLVVAPSGAAVVGTAAAGAIHVARFNGPRTAPVGIAQRADLTGCSFDAAAPPATLSATGCFDLSTPWKPVAHAGLVPYDVVAELWSDGAKKRRWIGLPAGTSMTLGSNGAWVAPAGTMLVKEFAIETTAGNPATRKAIETRFLVNDAQLGWRGFSYRWTSTGTNATLLGDAAYTINWQMDNGSQHAHVYPSRAHCRSCHYPAQGPILGLRPEQLARWFDYGGVIADQMATLSSLGVGPQSAVPAFTAPHDPSAPVDRRMRGYMHANCSHCHNPQYLNIKDLRFATPLSSTRLCESIVAGSPGQSVVYQRVTSRPGMPPLGTVAVDPLAQELLGTWISGMTSCP